jgi:hypothetical protein
LGPNDEHVNPAMLLIALYTLKPMLIARADVSGIIACVREGYAWMPSAPVPLEHKFNSETDVELCRTFLDPELADIISGGLAVRSNRTVFFGRAEQWAARAGAWLRAREAALPALGDVTNLVAQLPLMPDAHDWARLLGFLFELARKLQDPVAVMEALFAINRADVAAILYATAPRDCAPPSTVALFNRLAMQIGRHELQQQMARHGRRADPHSPVILTAVTIELPVWSESGEPQFTVRDTAFLDERLFLRPSDDDPHVAPGEPAVVSRSEFERRWEQLTGGVLDGFDWRNVVAANGGVAACLDPAKDASAPGQKGRPKDVDLFVYGLTPLGVKQVCCEIEVHAHKVAAARGIEYLTLVTSRTMTIIFGDEALPRIQVVLGQWESACDLLSTMSVDCCCVCLQRARRDNHDARTAVVDAPRERGVGCPRYECGDVRDGAAAVEVLAVARFRRRSGRAVVRRAGEPAERDECAKGGSGGIDDAFARTADECVGAAMGGGGGQWVVETSVSAGPACAGPRPDTGRSACEPRRARIHGKRLRAA